MKEGKYTSFFCLPLPVVKEIEAFKKSCGPTNNLIIKDRSCG